MGSSATDEIRLISERRSRRMDPQSFGVLKDGCGALFLGVVETPTECSMACGEGIERGMSFVQRRPNGEMAPVCLKCALDLGNHYSNKEGERTRALALSWAYLERTLQMAEEVVPFRHMALELSARRKLWDWQSNLMDLELGDDDE